MEGWRKLFKTHSVSEQLFPHLEDIGTTSGMYRAHLDDVTQELIDAGIVKQPHPEDIADEATRWEEVAKTIDTINREQHVILPHSIYPESDFFSRKEDALLPLRYNPDNPVGVAQELQLEMGRVTLDDIFVGYDIQGVFHTDRYYRITTLMDCTRGKILYNTKVVNGKDIAYLTSYAPEVQSEGANASVKNVPSIDSDRLHEVALERIPVYHSDWGKSKVLLDRLTRSSFNFESRHACRRVTRKSGFIRRTRVGDRYGSEVDFDYHTVAAFYVVKDRLESQGFRVANPFYEPDTEFFKLFQKLHKNVLIEHEEDGRKRRLPMTLNEMELTSWKIIGYWNSRV